MTQSSHLRLPRRDLRNYELFVVFPPQGVLMTWRVTPSQSMQPPGAIRATVGGGGRCLDALCPCTFTSCYSRQNAFAYFCATPPFSKIFNGMGPSFFWSGEKRLRCVPPPPGGRGAGGCPGFCGSTFLGVFASFPIGVGAKREDVIWSPPRA